MGGLEVVDPQEQGPPNPAGPLVAHRSPLSLAVGPHQQQSGLGPRRSNDHPPLGPPIGRGGRAVLDQVEAEHVDEEPDGLVVVVDEQRHLLDLHRTTVEARESRRAPDAAGGATTVAIGLPAASGPGIIAAMEYYDLGPHRRPVSTDVAEAQTWFDRGLNWLYGFNHGESVACFQRAIEADDGCALAHWGLAVALGPNYNLPWHLMDRRNRARALAGARQATDAALALADRVTPVERALIEALPARYPQAEPLDDPTDQMAWNRAFTTAMRTVHQEFPDDLDVTAVFVDAIMNETPWQMWDLSSGQVAPDAGTIEARRSSNGPSPPGRRPGTTLGCCTCTST